MRIHFVWGYNLVWGYRVANQNRCMTTNLCLGFLFWRHTTFNQTQTMVGTTCLMKPGNNNHFFDEKTHKK